MRNKSVILGLGSNLGNPIENLRAALSALRKSSFFDVGQVSAIYESSAQLPLGATADWQRTFLNAAVECECDKEKTPEEILSEIKKIESELGRKCAETWAPRIIDIDILFWDRPPYKSEHLQIPHARLFERPFALLPLLELWPQPAASLPEWAKARSGEKPFGTKRSRKYFWPRFVGILNITADSFSDGGKYTDPEKLLKRAEELAGAGAEILDLGAESTRPGASHVPAEKELAALKMGFETIQRSGLGLKLSLDCRHANVVSALLENFKIDFLNDVSGFADPAMQQLLLASGATGFVMHSLSVPPRKDLLLSDAERLCLQLLRWWTSQRQILLDLGVNDKKLVFDPGIGFGKSTEQNYYILSHLSELSPVKEDIMIGHSRKSFLGNQQNAENRDVETAAVTAKMNLAFVQYLRVHDVPSQQAVL